MKCTPLLLAALWGGAALAQDTPITTTAPASAPANSGDRPIIEAETEIFLDSLDVAIRSPRPGVEVRYTLDGAAPTLDSPKADGTVRVTETATVRARAYRGESPAGETVGATFTKVSPQPAMQVEGLVPGLRYDYYEGEWDNLPQFPRLTPVASGTIHNFELSVRQADDGFALRYLGFISIPTTGVYRFWLRSDEGSRLYVARKLVADHDGLHGPTEKSGAAALEAGLHSIALTYFEKSGNEVLEVSFAGPGMERRPIADADLSHAPK